MKDISQIKDIERESREGADAAKRRDFGVFYRSLLTRVFDQIYTEGRDYTGRNKIEIACKKGCAACCSQFISASVSHGVLVTDYLYAHADIMSLFLNNYENWMYSFENNPKADAILKELEGYTTSAGAMKNYPQEICVAYHKLDIPCPFLDRGQCSIREVRPIVCAAYFSVSPAEHCRPGSSFQPEILEVTPSGDYLLCIADLTDHKLYQHQEPLPKLVYKLVTRGLPQVSREVTRLFDRRLNL